MNMRGLKYVVKRGDKFQLRLPVPKDVQRKLKRKEIRWSLSTSDKSVAAKRAYGATLAFLDLCASVRRMENLTEAKINEIISAFFKLICSAYVPSVATSPEDGFYDKDQSLYAAETEMSELTARLEATAFNDEDFKIVRDYSSEHGVDFDQVSPMKQTKLLEGIARVRIENAKFIEHMFKSVLDPYTPEDPLFRDALQSIAKVPKTVVPDSDVGENIGPLVDDLHQPQIFRAFPLPLIIQV